MPHDLTSARKNARTPEDAAAIAWAQDEIEHLRQCLSRFSGLASSALAPLQIMEQEAATILCRIEAQETE